MDFDVAQPAREEYRDSELGDTLINKAVEQAWSSVGSGRVTDDIKKWLQKPDRLGSGMTARDVQIRLGAPGAMQLVSKGQATGRLTLTVPGNEIDLTTTHPLSQGPGMDPRVRVRFDLQLTLSTSTSIRLRRDLVRSRRLRSRATSTCSRSTIGRRWALRSTGSSRTSAARRR